jgi:hypothetical protein
VKNSRYLSLFAGRNPDSIAVVSVDILRAELNAIHLPVYDSNYAPRDITDVLNFPKIFGNRLDELRRIVTEAMSGNCKPVVIVAGNQGPLDLASPLVAALCFLAQEGACSVPMSFINHESSRKVLLGFEQTADPVARTLPLSAALPKLVSDQLCRSYAEALFGDSILPTHIAHIAIELENDELAQVYLRSNGEVQSSHDIVNLLSSCCITDQIAINSTDAIRKQEDEDPANRSGSSLSHVRTDSDKWLAMQSFYLKMKPEKISASVVSGTEAFSICPTQSTCFNDFARRVPLRYALTQRRHSAIGDVLVQQKMEFCPAVFSESVLADWSRNPTPTTPPGG